MTTAPQSPGGAELGDHRLLLRPPQLADVPAITAACQDGSISRWIPQIPTPFSEQHALHWVTELADPARTWMVTERSSGRLLGAVGLHASRDLVLEVGYWLTAEARGKGVATEAVRMACEYAFGVLGVQRVEWVALVGNTASLRVAERVGFQLEGTCRGRLVGRDGPADAWLAGLLPHDLDRPGPVTAPRVVPLEPVTLPVDDTLVLRPMRDEDAPAVLAAYQDRDQQRWNPAGVTVDEEAALDFCRRRADWTAGDHASWTVAAVDDDRLLGTVSLHHVDPEQSNAEVGYWTVAEARGRGVASRAVAAATGYAFDRLGLARVELFHAVANPASCRVAAHAGFALEGRHRASYRYGDGRLHDEHSHARLATDEAAAEREGPATGRAGSVQG